MSTYSDPEGLFFFNSEMPLKLNVGHQRSTSETAFRCRADDCSKLNAGLVAFVICQGIRTSIAKKHFSFVIARVWVGEGEARTPCPPSGSWCSNSYVTC